MLSCYFLPLNSCFMPVCLPDRALPFDYWPCLQAAVWPAMLVVKFDFMAKSINISLHIWQKGSLIFNILDNGKYLLKNQGICIIHTGYVRLYLRIVLTNIYIYIIRTHKGIFFISKSGLVAMRKAAFYAPKRGLLHYKKPCFGFQTILI